MANGGIKLDSTKIVGVLLAIVMSMGIYVFKTGIDTARDDRARLYKLIDRAVENQGKIQKHQAEIELQMVRIMTVIESEHQ